MNRIGIWVLLNALLIRLKPEIHVYQQKYLKVQVDSIVFMMEI